MTTNLANYVVITPVRDEEKHLESTIEHMVKQTATPKQWVIVNDGSKDRTGEIADGYAKRYPWIKVVHRQDRGFRKAGGGVVDAFNDGYHELDRSDWNFVVKFDGDLTFDGNYFEECFKEFASDDELGVGGGVICYIDDGKKSFETTTSFHVRGATKIYRKACWESIGGLLSIPGWDTMDEVKANSCGWKTRSFPHLHLVHQRDTGSADGMWPTLVKYGRANYICGYHPLFMLGKCFKRLAQKPYLIGSIGLMYGFIYGYLMKVPQVADRQVIDYLRREQVKRMFGSETMWK
ncbi:glycosyltransferase [Tunturiibacter lichenicola]|uniref:glycosyltransferase n=1 Tax=Tunturiibacter lichenicola TaxID=2051959 RepID=UPI003D9B095F